MRWIILCLFSLFHTASFAEAITYEVGGETFESYFISPSDDAPLVFLIHDWDGVTEYEIKRAEMLYKEGYAVFAIDMFGQGIRPDSIADRRFQTGQLYRDRARMRQLIHAGIDQARKLGANTVNSVMLGYCFGGTVALEMARSGLESQGFIVTHGSLKTPEHQNYKEVKAEVLVQHGAADANISMAEFAALNIAMESDGAANEMTAYSGAGHSFTKWSNDKYDPVADRKSWQRLLSFLQEKLHQKTP